MRYLDEKIKTLEAYLPPLTKRPDFDAFWAETRKIADAQPLMPTRVPFAYPSDHVAVYDITYCGFDDTVIHGWFIVPKFVKSGKLPCLIHYHGFGGSRGKPWQMMHWATQGLAVLSVDCRDQGGETGNRAAYSNGTIQHVYSRGVLDKSEHYHRALYMDALKAIDFALTCPEVDESRIIIEGGSQGGALVMAVAALDNRACVALPQVPSNTNIERRVEGRHGSYASINDYLRRYPDRVDQVYETLSYFDTMNMADKITCPVYASVGLSDPICPPECYYATYNRITAEKRIEVYPFNEHDGAGDIQIGKLMAYLKERGIV